MLKQAQSGLYHLQLIEQDLASAADEPLTESIRAYIQQQAQLIALCKDSEGRSDVCGALGMGIVAAAAARGAAR